MTILIRGIDLPKKIKAQHQHSSEYECETYIELYIRSDGVVFDDEFEEVGQAIQIDRPHCNDCKYNENGYCTMWFAKIEPNGYCYKAEE